MAAEDPGSTDKDLRIRDVKAYATSYPIPPGQSVTLGIGRAVASFQLVQELLADIAVETEAARLLVWRAAAVADRGERHTVEASYAKYFASEVAVRAANAAVPRRNARNPSARMPMLNRNDSPAE